MFNFYKKKASKSAYKPKNCVAVVPAAGSSSRMRGQGDKLFAKLDDMPVIAFTLLALEAASCIDEIIIPTREDFIVPIYNICKEYGVTKVSKVIRGGATRAESVLSGVLCAENRFDLIAVHDAARPFATVALIEAAVAAAARYGAAAPAVPVKDTIKTADGGIVTSTLPRDTLFAVQTPQVFDSALLYAALNDAVQSNATITDDCSAVERMGMRVFLTNGDYSNIKITTPEDITHAAAIAGARGTEEEVL